MIPLPSFDANVVLAHNDLASAGWAVNPQRAMDEVERALSAMPDVAAIEITYLGARTPVGPRIQVRLSNANSPNSGTDERAVALERRITKATYRVLANLTGRIMRHPVVSQAA